MPNLQRSPAAVLVAALAVSSVCAAHAQDASQPYLGQIMLVSFSFPPKGWAECNGQLLPINQNQALFSLLGTTYGGDGRVTFALPDLRGRVPVHAATAITLGSKGGEEVHTLTIAEIPLHTHAVRADSGVGITPSPVNAYLAREAGGGASYASTPNATAAPAITSGTGGNQPHENRMPYLGLRFIIALTGVFPSRN